MSKFIDDWASAIVVLLFAYFAYSYLSNYDKEREQKFEAMHECMDKTEYDEGDFDRCADEVRLKP